MIDNKCYASKKWMGSGGEDVFVEKENRWVRVGEDVFVEKENGWVRVGKMCLWKKKTDGSHRAIRFEMVGGVG